MSEILKTGSRSESNNQERNFFEVYALPFVKKMVARLGELRLQEREDVDISAEADADDEVVGFDPDLYIGHSEGWDLRLYVDPETHYVEECTSESEY